MFEKIINAFGYLILVAIILGALFLSYKVVTHKEKEPNKYAYNWELKITYTDGVSENMNYSGEVIGEDTDPIWLSNRTAAACLLFSPNGGWIKQTIACGVRKFEIIKTEKRLKH